VDPFALAAAGFGALVVLIPVLLFGQSVRSSRRKVRAVASAWESFARARGYELSPPRNHLMGASPPTVSGASGGIPFELTFHLGGGGATSGSAWTELTRSAEPFPRPLGMRIAARGLGSLGLGERHPTGDSAFDERYGVHATDPAAARLVGADCRECLMLLAGAGRDLSLDVSHGVSRGYAEDCCRLALHGQLVTDHGTLELAIRALTSLGSGPAESRTN
jgi:hypothetical protein